VVTGPEAGNVWCDDRADWKGLFPLLRVSCRPSRCPGKLRIASSKSSTAN
jgi:hypothetical protein